MWLLKPCVLRIVPLIECIVHGRPISLLPITGKILEKFIHKQTATYLEGHSLLTDKQNGFRARRGTQDTVIKLAKDNFESLNNGDYMGAVYIDYRKAFDTINHAKLLEKMPSYGFSESVIEWYAYYLSGRSQNSKWCAFELG